MNEIILTYIEEYRKTGLTTTGSVEVKNLIVEYLNSKNENFFVKFDGDYLQYTISVK